MSHISPQKPSYERGEVTKVWPEVLIQPISAQGGSCSGARPRFPPCVGSQLSWTSDDKLQPTSSPAGLRRLQPISHWNVIWTLTKHCKPMCKYQPVGSNDEEQSQWVKIRNHYLVLLFGACCQLRENIILWVGDLTNEMPKPVCLICWF